MSGLSLSIRHAGMRESILVRQGLLFMFALAAALLAAQQFAPPEPMAHELVTSLIEVATIAIAVVVFVLGWSSHAGLPNRNLLWFGGSFLAAALLDFIHLHILHLRIPVDPGQLFYFWTWARYAMVGALAALILPAWRPARPRERVLMLAAVLGGVGMIAYLGTLVFDERPPAVLSPMTELHLGESMIESGLVVLLLMLAFALIRRSRSNPRYNLRYLLAGIFAAVASETCLSAAPAHAGWLDLFGHLYKVIAYGFFYRAVFVERVREPFQRITRSERHFRQVMEAANDGIVIVDASGRITQWNPALERMFGLSRDRLLGAPIEILLPERFHAMHVSHRDTFIASPQPRLMGQGRELTGRRADGTEFPAEVALSPMTTDEGNWTMAIVRDVSYRREMERRLLHSATHDALTGLPNRTLLTDRLGHSMSRALRNGSSAAVVFIDLDGFKNVNDSLGHMVGDQLLVEVATRIRSALRAEDTVARLGGDEFVVLIEDLRHTEDAAALTQKLLAEIARPLLLAEHNLAISASAGIVFYPADGNDVHALLRNADVAMYAAKRLGKNQYHLFEAAMQRELSEKMTLLGDLREAVESESLVLHYQPKIDSASGRICGVEALLRWTHPQLGPVSPERFIPLAEESGLILPLGEWVLRTACTQARAWQDAGLPPLRMAVNLSAQQFGRTDLASRVAAVLAAAGLDAGWLELEITESQIMGDDAGVQRSLHQLKALGLGIAIDDFGTGYSSLAYLRRLPLDSIKIDRCFVRELPGNRDDAAIAGAIVSMSHRLGLRVVAEGVETEGQALFLKSLACEEMQGYHFSRPLPPDQLEALLRQDADRSQPAQTSQNTGISGA
ncbi:MAG: EAL domain-containing protein [Rhodocyclaceae bacterium]|jgi:diguanylate cyclase (GGDEF)-like protein/PAS domain S-box-containing protein|nr:EAL domain-containing protein [Rhodocyclaceae bacterium]